LLALTHPLELAEWVVVFSQDTDYLLRWLAFIHWNRKNARCYVILCGISISIGVESGEHWQNSKTVVNELVLVWQIGFNVEKYAHARLVRLVALKDSIS
jgi:hypothetical protein